MSMMVDNQQMVNAKGDIDTAASNFKSAGTNFIASLTSALGSFEGETKDVLISKKIGASGSETEGTLAYFVEKQIPDLITSLGELLEGNRSTVEESDKKLAEAISGNGQ